MICDICHPSTEKAKMCVKDIPKSDEDPEESCVDYSEIDEHPMNLIPDLLKQFYYLHWVRGTSGSMSIVYDDKIYVAPSGVQKERVTSEDLFVLDTDGNILERPCNQELKCSQNTSMFLTIFRHRNAHACIHTHSPDAVMVTELLDREFRIKNQEMMKGIRNDLLGRNYRSDEELIVPIVENTFSEGDLDESIKEAALKYPATSAVLVRHHGIFVWGPTWETAKVMCECYDYLFKLWCKMRLHGCNRE